MKRILFIVILVAIPLAVVSATIAVLFPRLEARARPLLLQHMANNLTAEERKAIYDRLAQGTEFWDVLPDPDVGGVGQRNRTVTHAGAEVHLNNVGMRARKPYGPKAAGTFRLVCLGDSFVFGMGGPEEDRFCDQLQTFYRSNGIQVGGREIETYAVGLPSWTLVQSTTYLTARLSDFDPDVVVVLSVANDISDNMGITGIGALTYNFSTEQRALGSSIFVSDLNRFYGDGGTRTALAWDVSPQSRARWDKAMLRLRRLAEAQTARGKRVLTCAMTWQGNDQPDDYAKLFRASYARSAVPAPMFFCTFLPSRRTTLPHDDHPSREGHRLLRDQYIHALHRLGWIAVPDTLLPPLDRRTPVRLDPNVSQSDYEGVRSRFLSNLRERVDFTNMQAADARALLGGILPHDYDVRRALEGAPWASTNAALVLRRPAGGALRGVEAEIELPDRPELFPFVLTLYLDGARAGELRVERRNESGRYRVSGTPSAKAFHDDAVEVMLRTESYYTTLDDTRMRSYRLLRVRAY